MGVTAFYERLHEGRGDGRVQTTPLLRRHPDQEVQIDQKIIHSIASRVSDEFPGISYQKVEDSLRVPRHLSEGYLPSGPTKRVYELLEEKGVVVPQNHY